MSSHRILCIGPDAWAHTDAGRTMAAMRCLAARHHVLYAPFFGEHAPSLVGRDRFRQVFRSLST